MKTKYKFIHFVEVTSNWWGCYNNRTKVHLGTVELFSEQYEFAGMRGAWFTAGCLRDIADFMDQLKELR